MNISLISAVAFVFLFSLNRKVVLSYCLVALFLYAAFVVVAKIYHFGWKMFIEHSLVWTIETLQKIF